MKKEAIESVLKNHGFTVLWALGEKSWIKTASENLPVWFLIDDSYAVVVTVNLTKQEHLRQLFQTMIDLEYNSGAFIPNLPDRSFGSFSVYVFFRQKTDEGHQKETDEIINNFGDFIDDLSRLG